MAEFSCLARQRQVSWNSIGIPAGFRVQERRDMSLAQKAYDHLQEGVLSGRLRSGTVISEQALARELGISRTPVGEAIRQLVREGLVEQVPRYGTIVRSIDRRELIDLYEMREAIESYAAAKAAELVSDAALDRLQQFCDVMENIERDLR